MTITPEAVLQVAQIGILMGIFLKLGKFGEAIETLKSNQSKLGQEQSEVHDKLSNIIKLEERK